MNIPDFIFIHFIEVMAATVFFNGDVSCHWLSASRAMFDVIIHTPLLAVNDGPVFKRIGSELYDIEDRSER